MDTQLREVLVALTAERDSAEQTLLSLQVDTTGRDQRPYTRGYFVGKAVGLSYALARLEQLAAERDGTRST